MSQTVSRKLEVLATSATKFGAPPVMPWTSPPRNPTPWPNRNGNLRLAGLLSWGGQASHRMGRREGSPRGVVQNGPDFVCVCLARRGGIHVMCEYE